MSGEDLLTGAQVASSCCVLTWLEGTKQVSGVTFIRTLILFVKAHPHDQLTSQEPHFLWLSQWKLDLNTQILEEEWHTNIQSLTVTILLLVLFIQVLEHFHEEPLLIPFSLQKNKMRFRLRTWPKFTS